MLLTRVCVQDLLWYFFIWNSVKWDACDVSSDVKQTSLNIVSSEFCLWKLCFILIIIAFFWKLYWRICCILFRMYEIIIKLSMVSPWGVELLSALKTTGAISISSWSGCILWARLGSFPLEANVSWLMQVCSAVSDKSIDLQGPIQ